MSPILKLIEKVTLFNLLSLDVETCVCTGEGGIGGLQNLVTDLLGGLTGGLGGGLGGGGGLL